MPLPNFFFLVPRINIDYKMRKCDCCQPMLRVAMRYGRQNKFHGDATLCGKHCNGKTQQCIFCLEIPL